MSPISTAPSTLSPPGTATSIPQDVLCPNLIARRGEGLTLKMACRGGGRLGPHPQEEVLEVTDPSAGPMMHAYVRESGANPGILVETAQHCPIAFVGTSGAVREKSAQGRWIDIRRATANGWDTSQPPYIVAAGPSDNPTLAEDPDADPQLLYVMRREVEAGRHEVVLLIHVDAQGHIDSICGPSGAVVASVAEEGGSQRLRVHSGTDAALVFCAVMAVQKLG